MELIIKLDDDIAKGIRGENECEVEPREIVRSFQATIADAIKNGTPYNPSGDCISRKYLQNLTCGIIDEDGNIHQVVMLADIDNAQAVPLPNEQTAWEQGYEIGLAQGKLDRPQGEWINEHYWGNEYYHTCNVCNTEMVKGCFNDFCSNCGADMRKGGALQNSLRESEAENE